MGEVKSLHQVRAGGVEGHLVEWSSTSPLVEAGGGGLVDRAPPGGGLVELHSTTLHSTPLARPSGAAAPPARIFWPFFQTYVFLIYVSEEKF